MRRAAHTIATGPEDDGAFRALYDLASIAADHPEVRVIGGHMVGLLAAAFPSPGLVARRTGDADAGLPLTLADDGSIHASLVRAGYNAIKGNRYVHDQRVIDVLVPTLNGRFGDTIRAGRAYDAMPGLHLALGAPIVIDANLTLTDGTVLECAVPVPTVENAVVLKAYAWRDRWVRTVKDTVDLSNLLHIVDAHGRDEIGGWRLDEGGLQGARGDAVRILHQMIPPIRAGSATPPALDRRKLEVLIRRWARE
ncbi:hypothetical protein [Frondihabitans australicus]|uniref:Uncharacterized protein n=1 Tax=Frondihabitans australicus TaxID=386892 RepID=A0A495II08_9MICO|nr:hypothetical protein [Frondihabitans australicus]RKR75672.1 hypothetical protein C8E83_2820 [Frondihabitans australicus]